MPASDSDLAVPASDSDLALPARRLPSRAGAPSTHGAPVAMRRQVDRALVNGAGASSAMRLKRGQGA